MFSTVDDLGEVQARVGETMTALIARDNPERFISNGTLLATYLASIDILRKDPNHANARMGACMGAIGCMCLAFNDAIGPKRRESDAAEVEFLAVTAFFTSALSLTEPTARRLWGMCWDPLMKRVPLLPGFLETQERQMRVMEAAMRGMPEYEAMFEKYRSKKA